MRIKSGMAQITEAPGIAAFRNVQEGANLECGDLVSCPIATAIETRAELGPVFFSLVGFAANHPVFGIALEIPAAPGTFRH
jgi:hypothetical protein